MVETPVEKNTEVELENNSIHQEQQPQQNDHSMINMSAIEANEVADSITSVEKDFMDQTQKTVQDTRVPAELLEESKLDESNCNLIALNDEALAEAEEAKQQVAAALAREQSSFYQARVVGATGEQVQTSKLHEYINAEL